MRAIDTFVAHLETLLDQLEEAPEEQLPKVRESFLQKLCEQLGLDGKEPDRALFDAGLRSSDQKSVVVWLLRMIAKNPRSLLDADPTFRAKVFGLFDLQLSQEYKAVGIQGSEQNFQKVEKLKHCEPNLFREFKHIADGIVSLTTAMDARKTLMKAIKHPVHKLFLDEFVDPALLTEIRLSEMFEKLEEFNQATEPDRVNVFTSFSTICRSLLDAATIRVSSLSECTVAMVLRSIEQVTAQDFGLSTVILPTTVVVRNSDRKYPLHKSGERLQVKLLLENEGPGHAFDVEVVVERIEPVDKGISVRHKTLHYGYLRPGHVEIFFEAEIKEQADNNPSVLGSVTWKNFNEETVRSEPFLVEIAAQRNDLDWEALKLRKPYSLAEVRSEDQLVGRRETLTKLYAKLTTDQIESVILYGQKRVGKTSIARAIESKLSQLADYVVTFIRIGDLDKTTPALFVKSLGEQITRKLMTHLPKAVMNGPTPAFENSLTPLIDLLESVQRTASKLKIIIIIDEFDEIPIEFRRYTAFADTFFHNLRSLSQEPHVGFVLVGGENMQTIMHSTDRLNTFEGLAVDYFDKERYFADFQELVKRPVKHCLEFSDLAIDQLYEVTEGNPFFAKMICGSIYERACLERDAYVSVEEILAGVRASISIVDSHNVNHFWKDGIDETEPAERDLVETQRRKVLVAFAEIRRNRQMVSKSELETCDLLRTEHALQHSIERFINRKILLLDGGYYRIKPLFFERWLVERGAQIISREYLDEKAVAALQQREQAFYVTDEEINKVCKEWGIFRSSRITGQDVRIWLNQFATNTERRRMFSLLENLRFYSEELIRDKLTQIHRRVMRGIDYQREKGESRQHDCLISSFGSLGKSGSTYVRMYIQENEIYHDNSVGVDKIGSALANKPELQRIKTIVFIDDLIGTGGSVREGLEQLEKSCLDVIRERKIRVVVATICGIADTVASLKRECVGKALRPEFIVLDQLQNSDLPFSEESCVFESAPEREQAREVALRYGGKVQPKQPLGKDGSQCLIVFHDNCPNNTLPILWASSTNPPWTPLFRRIF